MKNFLFFNEMLTPKIITVVYWLLLLACLLSGLGAIISAMAASRWGVSPGLGILSGLGIIVGGSLGARLYCELIIVLFKIHDNTKKLAEKS